MAKYRYEILEEPVEIEFFVGEGEEPKFFRGIIKEVNLQENKDGQLQSKHYVEFADGDDKWVDLEHEERTGCLRWPNRPRTTATTNTTGTTTAAIKFKKRKRREDVVIKEEERAKLPPAHLSQPAAKYPPTVRKMLQYMDILEPDEKYFDRKGSIAGTRTTRDLFFIVLSLLQQQISNIQ
jgi:hypothetical protein